MKGWQALFATGVVFCMLWPAGIAIGQVRLLDDFETLSGWRSLPSEGARLHLSTAPGKTGNCMVMEFDLSGVYGYVIAQKDFVIDPPADYQFTFDMRAEAPVNNFEFKVMDEKDNVFWIKTLNVTYPKEWTKQRIKKRHLTFAWGPERRKEVKAIRKIEFVVSVGSGGTGKVYIDNFRFEPIDTSRNAPTTLVGDAGRSSIDSRGALSGHWKTLPDSVVLDFHAVREVGGVIMEWADSAHAVAYDLEVSDDGLEWSNAYSVRNGNGGRDYLYTHDAEGRFLKLRLRRGTAPTGVRLQSMKIEPPPFSSSTNEFYRMIASGAREGLYPRYLLNKQSYWTVMGVDGDGKEALMNEQGQIEVDKQQFMLEPFLFVDGRLITWSDVTTTPDLYRDNLPLPSVFWDYKGEWQIRVEACVAGVPGNAVLGVRYDLYCGTPGGKEIKFFVAIRPFQVNPPWQALNVQGGVVEIDSMVYRNGLVQLNGMEIVPVTPLSGFGAAEFDQGDITEYLADGKLPITTEVHDHFRHASGAFMYQGPLHEGQTAEIVVAVPLHGPRPSPVPGMGGGSASAYYGLMFKQTANQWGEKINTFDLALPADARDVANTVKANIGYILVNRDGPGIQPGSRSYDRSWIRDGSLTCSALLRTGHDREVREFLDWYARGQFPNGKIPCVIDHRGPDVVSEHDSHGQFIYAVAQYFLFTHDTSWLKGKWEAVRNTVRYIQSIRSERKTDLYRNGTPEQRALFGLLPESISHEGYWDVPRHSYWDDFFALRGLKDAVTIATALGERAVADSWAAEVADFRRDLYASMRQAILNTGIDYIPGCAELGDFDATSTTVGVCPGGELGNIPEPQLHNTFDRYFAFFRERAATGHFVNYTPYETRTIGTFVYLGQKARADSALTFFMKDRRPPAWNHWAEVVWRNPDTACFIGDMPHTWVGSDFVRSVLSMFVYDREADGAHVLCAGVPDRWILDSAGVAVSGLRTWYGTVGFTVRATAKRAVAEVSGSFDAGSHPLVFASPLSKRPRSVRVDGKKVTPTPRGEVRLRKLPANVEFFY